MVSTNYGSFNNEFTATKLMLNFFKLLGLAPFIVQSSSIPKMWKRGAGQGSPDVQFVACRLGRLYGLLLVPLQFRMVLIAWPVQFAYEYPDKSSMSKTISECESVLHNTVLFVVWLAAAVKQKTAVKILNRLVSFDVVTFCRDEDSFSESSRWFFALGSSANVLVWTGLLFTEWWTYRAPVLTWFAIIVPTFFLTWFLMQYVFVVKLIEKRFRALNRAVLAESVDSSMGFQQRSPVARNALMNDSRGPKITTISRGHTNLYEIAMDTSDFYSLPILLTIAFVSYTALYNTYYITVPFFNEVEEDVLWIIVNCVFWVISVMFPVAMLTFGVTNVAREVHTDHLWEKLKIGIFLIQKLVLQINRL